MPRDSLVQVGDQMLKINAVMQVFGKKELVTQVESITGQHIDHVAKLTFGGLTKVVDALGGVELCYDQDVDDEKSELHWKSGCHVVDGRTALAFSRMRYSDPRSDFGRSDRQRQVIGAIAQKATAKSTLLNIGKLKKVGEAALGSLTVDDKSTPWTMLQMLLAFRDASGSNGITGSLYWTDPGYYVDGVGSSVLLDNQKNLELFKQLHDGDHAPGQWAQPPNNNSYPHTRVALDSPRYRRIVDAWALKHHIGRCAPQSAGNGGGTRDTSCVQPCLLSPRSSC
nr:LCP family protein [Bifidobacterium animalis]